MTQEQESTAKSSSVENELCALKTKLVGAEAEISDLLYSKKNLQKSVAEWKVLQYCYHTQFAVKLATLGSSSQIWFLILGLIANAPKTMLVLLFFLRKTMKRLYQVVRTCSKMLKWQQQKRSVPETLLQFRESD